MNTSIVTPNIDSNHAARGRGWGAGLFMLVAVVGGCVLVAKALRLVRCHHKPHASHYSHPRH